ncbi:hypothetical protein ACFY1U_46090 [Streptomyces sp. NPDC001351]|uniref:hypothetical protein n=1 Tax=Streptomyces sp. NPDC001351 TaxID=3364564 RepID=UPI00367EDFAE
MSHAVDPRLAYAQVAAPATTAAPALTTIAQPEPSPSPGPPPTPPPPAPPVWGGDPDVGVSSSFLRARADDCETTSGLLRRTGGPAEDSFRDLAKAAPGWSFVGSIDDMQHRWEDLLKVVTDRLDTAARNFRDSADAYDGNEVSTASQFADPHTPNPSR